MKEKNQPINKGNTMLKIFTSPSCGSCRKVKDWLKKYDIPYTEYDITKNTLTPALLTEILEKSINGTEEIVSTRSKDAKNRKFDIEGLSFNEIIAYLIANPLAIKRPIIVGKYSIQVGYNSQEIQRFAPKDLRQKWMDELVIEEEDEEEEESDE